MILIKRIKNEENIYYYLFENTVDTHNNLIGFLHDAGFDNNGCNEVDTPFLELEGECFSVKKEEMVIHFFICNNKTWMVIDYKGSQVGLLGLMQNHFLFPK